MSRREHGVHCNRRHRAAVHGHRILAASVVVYREHVGAPLGQVERPAEVAETIRSAAQYIDLDKLIVSSDCGFGREGLGRGHAFFKSAALAIGANIVRREHGLPETYVPAADEKLAMDQVPATYID
jgi:hypothetical protein